jgi:hypothetical protein
VSGRQKAPTCSDFCRLADAKPTCAAEKTSDSLERAPTQADATPGRTALQSVRELVGDSRSENHNLNSDWFLGGRSVRNDVFATQPLALEYFEQVWPDDVTVTEGVFKAPLPLAYVHASTKYS